VWVNVVPTKTLREGTARLDYWAAKVCTAIFSVREPPFSLSLSLAVSIESHKAHVGLYALQSLAWRSSQFHTQPRNTNCASTYCVSLAGLMTEVTDIEIVILVLTCYVHYIVALLRVQCIIHLGHRGESPS
jgi:hypothetical protein